jgi:hypothetical protein
MRGNGARRHNLDVAKMLRRILAVFQDGFMGTRHSGARLLARTRNPEWARVV